MQSTVHQDCPPLRAAAGRVKYKLTNTTTGATVEMDLRRAEQTLKRTRMGQLSKGNDTSKNISEELRQLRAGATITLNSTWQLTGVES